MSLNFAQASGGLNVQMPVNGNYAPPGYYLLSIVDGNGVPSVAGMIRLSAPGQDATAPTAPADLVGSASPGQIALNWTASTDNVGVTSYRVSRDGTVIGTSTSTHYTDSSVLAGTTYNYTVSALDAAGNVSPPSNAVAMQAVGTPGG